MFGRISNKDKRPPQAQAEGQTQPDAETPMVDDSLIDTDTDGESLMVPNDYRYKFDGDTDGDEVTLSSMNTSTYGGMVKNDFKILGVADNEYDSEMGMETDNDDYIGDTDTDNDTYMPLQERPLSNKQRAVDQHPYNYRKQYPDDQGDASAETPTGAAAAASAGASPDSRTKGSQSQTSKDSKDKNGAAAGGCCIIPLWIIEAPVWLKLVIVLSTALLVGAIVLIGVGAALAIQENDNSPTQSSSENRNNNANANDSPTMAPTPDMSSFTLAPVPAPTRPIPTSSPSMAPVTESPTNPGETRAPSPEPTPAPTTRAPTPAPTPAPTIFTTPFPTRAPTPLPVTFLITAGRFTLNNLEQLPDRLKSLPTLDGNTVMFHLGDWNSPFATACNEASYRQNQNMYSQSTVPVYFVPGDNEYNDCPVAELALSYWYEYNLEFETKFWPASTLWTVTRQTPLYPENFAYVYQGVLFVGINLVGGEVKDALEWSDRHRANLAWIKFQYTENMGSISTMVILAHSGPDIPDNDPFFTILFADVQDVYTDTQVLFIHRNLQDLPWKLEPQYEGIENLQLVTVEGSVWPPMLVEIDAATGVADFDQDEWYDLYVNSIN